MALVALSEVLRVIEDVSTTMIYTHVLNRGLGVRNPADHL
jgi:site-specific recombinase XerD